MIIENFSISVGKKHLFSDAKLKILYGKRYGLLGPNGQGKTTLLRHLAAHALPVPSHIRMMYVEQEFQGSNLTPVEAVLAADTRLAELLAEEKALIHVMENDDDLSDEEWEEKSKKLQAISSELETMTAEAAEGRARKILTGLGFTVEMQGQPTSVFSGGWRMRVSLARALFIDPELLLLDEPTNHLDLGAVLWLDDHLANKRKGTLLVVSHDQDFLNTVVTDVIFLNANDKQLEYFKGDYEDFERMHENLLAKKKKDYEAQQRALKQAKAKGMKKEEAEEFVRKKFSGEAVTGKISSGAAGRKSKDKRGGGAAKPTNTDGGDSLQNALLQKQKEYVVNFHFSELDDTKPYIQVTDASFRYAEDAPVLFEGLNFGVNTSTRAVIVGPNGVGKTTLLKLLLGTLTPTSGEIQRVGNLRVGVYHQHFEDILAMHQSPVEYLNHRFPERKQTEQQLRKLLGRFGLEGHAHTIPIHSLSGGQKARVVFASLVLLRPHIIFLDEPTNHLDIESINALISAAASFQGGLVMVSHDARLIEQTNAKLWVCEGNKKVRFHAGTFDGYRKEILNDLEEKEREEDRKVSCSSCIVIVLS